MEEGTEAIPTESELQRIYGLTVNESSIYHRKLEGQTYEEIGEYLNIAPSSVKQTVYNAAKKIKAMNGNVDIVVSLDCNTLTSRRFTALMCLNVINMDQDRGGVQVGRYTMCLKHVKHTLGDLAFLQQYVFPYLNPICTSEQEADTKAREFVKLHLNAGGKKGEIGIAFFHWYADKYNIKFDKY